MGRYTPKIGGYQWNQQLVETRRRTREVVLRLERLEKAATTDATRVVILEGKVLLHESLRSLEQLLSMTKEGGGRQGME